MIMTENHYLDPATAGFLKEFKLGLSSVRDLSGQFDHRQKALKALGGYSTVFVTHWDPPDSLPMRVCYKELRPPASHAPEQVDLTKKTIKGERCDTKAILVSKWCANGNITEYLRNYPDVNRNQLIQDMARGVQCLHSQVPAVIHGDLKPHNVLISDQGTAQLCDFGLARTVGELSKSGEATTTGPGFTIRYSAIEVLTEEMKQ